MSEMIIPGRPNNFDPICVRLHAIERMLQPFTRTMIEITATKTGPVFMDVLGKVNGYAAISVPCPFAAYKPDPLLEEFAIGEGSLVTNIVTGEEKFITGTGGARYDLFDNTKVWIKCTIKADLTIDTVKIETGKEWPKDMIVWNAATATLPAVQTAAYVVVGEVLDGAAYGTSQPSKRNGFLFTLTRGKETKKFYFHQKLTTNLYSTLMVINGKVAIYLLPFPG